MSMENIVKFQEKISKDEKLMAKLKDVLTPEAVIAIAKAEGFEFSMEELAEHGKASVKTGKLSDEELDGVTGAGSDNFVVTIGYGCTDWVAQDNGDLWRAARGNCGSCKHYEDTAGIGIVGLCQLKSSYWS